MTSVGVHIFIYGPSQSPIEQVNNSTEKVQYLHHDQQGSTRLITGESGAVKAVYSYSPYGAVEKHEGSATTPLQYDGQLTSEDTGLIYLRNRTYDPATGQFTSSDPIGWLTRAPYSFAKDNPLRYGDASGLCNAEFWTESFWTEGNCVSESPLNFIHDYENEIESYENGCGYFASVGHGLEGALAASALIPEDWGPELVQKFANRFPKLAEILVNQQARRQVTQPGKLTVLKAALEKLVHLFGG